jgi:hypothetical protein
VLRGLLHELVPEIHGYVSRLEEGTREPRWRAIRSLLRPLSVYKLAGSFLVDSGGLSRMRERR